VVTFLFYSPVMLPLPAPGQPLPAIPPTAPTLTYEPLEAGKNFWIIDDVLPNAEEVSARCFAKRKVGTG
jgi:hypothetical protein